MRPSFALGFARHTGRRRNELMKKVLHCIPTEAEALRSGRSKIQNYDIMTNLGTLSSRYCTSLQWRTHGRVQRRNLQVARCIRNALPAEWPCGHRRRVRGAASVSGNAILFERARGGREGERRHEARIPFTFPPSYILIWRFLGPNLCYSLFNLPFHE